MAYLRRFIGLFGTTAILLILLIIVTTTTNAQIGNFREASEDPLISKILKNSEESLENFYSRKLEKMGIKLRPGTNHRSDSKPTLKTSRKCRAVVYKTLQILPSSHTDQLSQLTLFYTSYGRRGLGGKNAIVLRCLNVEDKELAAVLIHEVGHLVDAGLLTGKNTQEKSGFYDFEIPVPVDDPSLAFYQISWVSDTVRKSEATQLDFVSIYGITDPFEDFAETYTYYRLHGPAFRKLAETNFALREKYEFMKKHVFENEEFGPSEGLENFNAYERHYDITVLPYPPS